MWPLQRENPLVRSREDDRATRVRALDEERSNP
jgi:hypothetical protein